MADLATHSIDTAQRIQEKFQFYLLALTFTLLGLAVETASFGEYLGGDIAELVGWGLLVLSGVVGLLRLERIPVLFGLEHYRKYAGSEVIHMTKTAQQGAGEVEYVQGKTGKNVLSIDDAVQLRQHQIESVNKQFNRLSPLLKRAYTFQRWLLLLGIVALMVSRGWIGVAMIIENG